ncbi:Hypothetical predicted protein [Mytilus galloprovincialis]|uniref:Uncharacterized protein n=1 Tax=Mytilus galloprovincialis TaxID=29158 RepID=A0A8B6E207_MYTGA|nr:Hypothetical predicted protein [Mytilus galloprovincialis]
MNDYSNDESFDDDLFIVDDEERKSYNEGITLDIHEKVNDGEIRIVKMREEGELSTDTDQNDTHEQSKMTAQEKYRRTKIGNYSDWARLYGTFRRKYSETSSLQLSRVGDKCFEFLEKIEIIKKFDPKLLKAIFRAAIRPDKLRKKKLKNILKLFDLQSKKKKKKKTS